MNRLLHREVTNGVKINGLELDRWLRACKPAEKALVARSLIFGELELTYWTRRQALAATGGSSRYLSAVERLPEQVRVQIWDRQVRLSDLCVRRYPQDDKGLDALVAQVGAEKIFAALDRWTEPQLIAAE